MAGEGNITEDTVTKELQTEVHDTSQLITQMINIPRSLVGKRITHIWAPEEDDTEGHCQLYQGLVSKLKKWKKKVAFVVSYWKEVEGEESSSDWDVTLESLSTDLGNLHFLWTALTCVFMLIYGYHLLPNQGWSTVLNKVPMAPGNSSIDLGKNVVLK